MSGKAVIMKDESGTEVNIADFERFMKDNRLQMRITRDDSPGSEVHDLAVRSNFVGVNSLPPFHLELYKTSEFGDPIGDPIVEWITNHPFKVCRGLMDGLEDGGEFPRDLGESATVIRRHPQW